MEEKESITQSVPQIEKMQHAVPLDASHRLSDMLSKTNSNETKVTAARWYAEMIIDKFLSDSAKERLTPEKFARLSLGEAIEQIKGEFSNGIIDALYHIKNFGDKGTHYKKDEKISNEEAEAVVKKSLQLFNLLLIDHIKKVPLNTTPGRATIFSTLLPAVREHVLQEIIDFNNLNDDYQIDILHKYVLACVKNNKSSKIKRKLSDLLKKKKIEQNVYEFEMQVIYEIERGMSQNILPIPNNLADCSRNFAQVISNLDQEEINQNKRLIEINNKLLDEVAPSEMGSYIGNVNFLIQSEP